MAVKNWLAAVAMSACVFGASSASAAIVTNGGFEDPVRASEHGRFMTAFQDGQSLMIPLVLKFKLAMLVVLLPMKGKTRWN